MRRPIVNHEGNVYDPFIGSGTTICAAEQTKRTCYALEIEPKYVAVTLERLSDMGLKPELSNA
jgi:DNA modification methylase